MELRTLHGKEDTLIPVLTTVALEQTGMMSSGVFGDSFCEHGDNVYREDFERPCGTMAHQSPFRVTCML